MQVSLFLYLFKHFIIRWVTRKTKQNETEQAKGKTQEEDFRCIHVTPASNRLRQGDYKFGMSLNYIQSGPRKPGLHSEFHSPWATQ